MLVQKLEPNFTGIKNLNEDIRAATEVYILRRPNDVFESISLRTRSSWRS